MNIAEKIERHLLGTIRLLVLLGFIAVLLGLILVTFSILGQAGTVRAPNSLTVSAREVLSRLPGSELANDSLSGVSAENVALPDEPGLTIPAPLRTVLATDDTSQAAFDDWLAKIPPDDRQSFVTELSEVVDLAGQHSASWEWDDRDRYIASAMNEYAQMKLDRIATAQTALLERSERLNAFHTSLGCSSVYWGCSR